MFGGNAALFLIGSVFLIPAILVAIPVHELGHGVAAVAMGDAGPRDRGYLWARPKALFNLYGVVAAFLANVCWGNPIPVSEYRLGGAGRRVGYALGGPLANLAVAAIFGIAVRGLTGLGAAAFPLVGALPRQPLDYVASVIYAIFFLNLATFAFQLLPVPGLDGWRVVEALFRGRNPGFFHRVDVNTQTIWWIAVAVIFFGPLIFHFSPLGAAVGVLFEPSSSAILGECGRFVALDPCPL